MLRPTTPRNMVLMLAVKLTVDVTFEPVLTTVGVMPFSV